MSAYPPYPPRLARTYERTATACASSSWKPQFMPCGPAPPKLAQPDGDSPGTVSATYCSSGNVLTERAWLLELYIAGQRAVHDGAVVGLRNAQRKQPAPGRRRGGVGLIARDLRPWAGATRTGEVPTSPGTGRLEHDGADTARARGGNAGTVAPRRRRNEVESVVLRHVDAHVGAVTRKDVRLRRMGLGRHGCPVRCTDVGRRRSGEADQGGGAHHGKGEHERAQCHRPPAARRTGARHMCSDQHDPSRLVPRPA